VAARCAAELCRNTEHRIEEVLRIILEILEVSRIYVCNSPGHKKSTSSLVTHEQFAPGHQHYPEPYHSVYEVPIWQSNGQGSYLGVEDTLHQREWDKAEQDLLKTVASLLRKNPEEIRHSIAMYKELGMTA
jgi:hypothetical protein